MRIRIEEVHDYDIVGGIEKVLRRAAAPLPAGGGLNILGSAAQADDLR